MTATRAITTANQLTFHLLLSPSLLLGSCGLDLYHRRPAPLSRACLLKHERNGPEQLGPLAKLPRHDVHVLSRARKRAEAHRLPERVEQQVAGMTQVPPTTTRSGLTRLHSVATPHRSGGRRRRSRGAAGESPSSARLTTSSGQSSSPRLRAARLAIASAPRGLEAAAVAAAADLAVSVDRGVPDLARGAAAAAEQSPADHVPGADPGGELQVDHLEQPRPAPQSLGERAEAGVVVDWNRQLRQVPPRFRPASDPAEENRRQPTRPVWWTGPNAIPTPSTRRAPRPPRRAPVRPGRLPGPFLRPRRSRPPWPPRVSARMSWRRSASATARCRLPEVGRAASPAGIGAIKAGGRPLPSPRERRSLDRPRFRRSQVGHEAWRNRRA